MPAPPDLIWDDIRETLRRETTDFKSHLWLEPLELAAVHGRTLYVRAPDHIRTSVTERYLPLLRRAATERFHEHASVEIVGSDWREPATPAARPSPRDAGRAGHLNPKYTFEQFVISPENRFAHAAALAVAELPAHSYNPLFLHGSPGTGKTHLLHAVGDYVLRYGSGLSVRYATIEEFTGEFVEAIRARRTDRFKESFRSSDVVLIDDVQFLAGREKTREEFFHTFNSLLDSGRQLVMTSDCSPEDVAGLENRLIERFRAGLVVELEAPSLEARRAILAKRALLDGVEVPPEVVGEIAARVDTSVRALEGALIRVVAYASLTGEPPTPELVRHVLRRLGRRHRHRRLRDHRDPRRRGRRVRRRTSSPRRARPHPHRRHRTTDSDVPGARADRAQPARDRPGNRWPQPHHRDTRRQPGELGHSDRRDCPQRGRQPARKARSVLVMTDRTGRINSLLTGSISLRTGVWARCTPIYRPQSPQSR